MADDIDSDSDDEIEYSGMIQPPLIKQLKTILSEYPDDGQILKEIIQNAEDAGASEMKILYDSRRTVQHESTKKAPFRKYFRGPALLVYNNAVFSEEDWKGIKMLYSSIKEFDRTKVGRFGLGFKSVFHITDHPLIISGKQLLVLDPHQDSSKVCQTMQLRKLHKYKKMKVEDCLEAFSGVFGFDQTTLDSGHFEGTIFRFPLRQNVTNLSDNLYNKSKIDDLFMSFKDEAPVSLLFLKCLESITLLLEEEDSSNTHIGKFNFSVKIHESTVENVRSARAEMRTKIQNLETSLPSDSIMNILDITICITGDKLDTTKKWKVMNLFEGERNMSPAMKSLSCDESLSYSPYVGVAMDMDDPSDLKGHVFCFLPLPVTGKSLSGFPVHVNGFFALSQNRRVVKWPTADQILHNAHTDKAIQWNRALVSEVLSETYSKFILELIEESREHGNVEKYVTLVSQCIPNVSCVEEHWKRLIPQLVSKMEDIPMYFTPNKGGIWIEKNEAVFLRPSMDDDIGSTVRSVLAKYEQNTVEVEDHVWKTMKLEGNCEVTPDFLYKMLQTSDKYKDCTDQEKFHLIQYLLSSGNKNNLDGLSLLPLQNGTFTEFSNSNRSSKSVYMVSAENSEILIGMEDVLLRKLPGDLQGIFSDLITEGSREESYSMAIF